MIKYIHVKDFNKSEKDKKIKKLAKKA